MAGCLYGWRSRPIPGQGPGLGEGRLTFESLSEQASAGEPVGETRAVYTAFFLPLSRDNGDRASVPSLEPVRMFTVEGLGL